MIETVQDLADRGKIRPLQPSDVVEGRAVLIQTDENELVLHLIQEVLRPDDPWKAFLSRDGCRYGLQDTWVFNNTEE